MTLSNPFLLSKKDDHSQYKSKHDGERHGVSPFPLKFRHVFKIHPINTGNECGGNNKGGDDGQKFHDVIGAVALG